MDRLIQNDTQFKCLQTECKWIGSLNDYKVHKRKCFEEVECQYSSFGCRQKLNKGKVKNHNEENQDHHEILLLKTVQNLVEERRENRQLIQNLEQHAVKTDQELSMLKTENKDLESKVVNHSAHLKLEQILNTIESYQELQKMVMNDSTELKTKVEKQSDLLTKMEQKLCDSDDKHQQILKNRITQLERENSNLRQNIDRQKARINQLESQMNNYVNKSEFEESTEEWKNKLVEVEKDIINLKIFAEQASQLHTGICNWNTMEYCSGIIYQKRYEKIQSVKSWSEFVEKVSASDYNSCVYLQNMERAIADYSNYTIYPETYASRLEVLANSLEKGTHREDFLKINTCYDFNEISVVFLSDEEDTNFMKKLSSEGDDWYRQSPIMATRYVDERFEIAVELGFDREHIFLLHDYEESESVKIPVNGEAISLYGPSYQILNSTCIIFDLQGREKRIGSS
ncbi:uncharacterized protein MCAP_0864-like isoform X1 [Clytia hemisphaerica]